jgi:hypothetical protein
VLLMAISCRGSIDLDSRRQPRMCWLLVHHEQHTPALKATTSAHKEGTGGTAQQG